MRSFVVYWLPVVLWMGIIFGASSDAMSFQHSSRLIGPLARWLFPQLSDEAIHTLIVSVRKCAHLAEYAILACLIWRALRKPRRAEERPWDWPTVVNTLLLVMIYAASDEFHQRFVPSREASVVDVLIDTAGGVLALFFLWGLGLWRRMVGR